MSSKSEYTVHSAKGDIPVELHTNKTHAMTNDIVSQLKQIRKKKGLTQQDIADATGMKTPNVTRIETMKHEASLDALVRIADALGYEVRMELKRKKK